MALRDTMAANVRPHLQDDEPLQAVFGAQTLSQWLFVLTGVIPFVLFNRYRVVAVTDRRIAVFDSGRWSIKRAKGLVQELPRSVVLGPGSGLWHRVETGNGRLRVHRRFFKDLAAADAQAPAA